MPDTAPLTPPLAWLFASLASDFAVLTWRVEAAFLPVFCERERVWLRLRVAAAF